jgi:SprT-like family protein
LSYEKSIHFSQSLNAQFMATYERLFNSLNKDLLAHFLRDGAGRKCGCAPDCILAGEYRLKRYRGFAAKAVWSDKHGRKLDQITLVFDHGHPLDVKGLASTLAHEMVHATQFRDKTIGRGNYHNADFRDRMKSIGLQASHTGVPGGRDIGSGMTHYIIEHGPFDTVIDKILREGFAFPVEVTSPDENAGGTWRGKTGAVAKDPSKAKFYCQNCGQIARAKKTANLKCGRVQCCNQRLVLDWP